MKPYLIDTLGMFLGFFLVVWVANNGQSLGDVRWLVVAVMAWKVIGHMKNLLETAARDGNN